MSPYDARKFKELVLYVSERMLGDHEVIVYEASPFPVGRAMVEQLPVESLAEAGVTGLSTLYVPPRSGASADRSMMDRLGITPVREK